VDGLEQVIDQAVVGIEQELENERIGDEGGDGRQEQAGAEKAFELEPLTVEQHGEDQGEADHQGDLDREVDHGIGQGLEKDRVLEESEVVFQADEGVDAIVEVEQAQPERVGDRIEHEGQENEGCREEKDVGSGLLVDPVAAWGTGF